MARKIFPTITLGVVTIIAILFLTESNSEDREIIDNTFFIDAVYRDTGYVEITFHDKSDKSSSVIMEILGMEESFQKTYHTSQFVEVIEFSSVPKYGWEVHPITFEIDHKDLGTVLLKTEIHNFNEPTSPIVFGRP